MTVQAPREQTKLWRLSTSYGDVELMRARQDLPLDLLAEDGRYQVTVALFAEDGQESGRFDVGTLYVSGESRQFSAPSPKTPLAVNLGSSLALVGFDGPRQNSQSLDLTLFWQAKEEMDISYKYFVHLFDVKSGELAAQLDGVPRDWSYPTNVWHAGEYVSDPISLPLTGVENGRYRLEVGMYHPDTGERLLAVNADGEPLPDNSIPLGEIRIE